VAKGATLRFAGTLACIPCCFARVSSASRSTWNRCASRARSKCRGDLALLSLPGTVLPAFPLAIDRERGEAMVTRLAKLQPPPRVALAWRAGLPHEGTFTTLYKELPIEAFGAAPGRRRRGSRCRGIPAGELDALSAAIGAPVHDFSDERKPGRCARRHDVGR
jgi:hypothetical protein